MLLRAEQSRKLDEANLQPRKKPLLSGPSAKIIRPAVTSVKKFRAIPHNSKFRYGERGAADAKPKAQIILDAAKVSAASGGNSEPKQGQRSQSARGFCSRSTMRVPQPDIIEHFGNADAVPQPPERCLSRQAGIVRYYLNKKPAQKQCLCTVPAQARFSNFLYLSFARLSSRLLTSPANASLSFVVKIQSDWSFPILKNT